MLTPLNPTEIPQAPARFATEKLAFPWREGYADFLDGGSVKKRYPERTEEELAYLYGFTSAKHGLFRGL